MKSILDDKNLYSKTAEVNHYHEIHRSDMLKLKYSVEISDAELIERNMENLLKRHKLLSFLQDKPNIIETSFTCSYQNQCGWKRKTVRFMLKGRRKTKAPMFILLELLKHQNRTRKGVEHSKIIFDIAVYLK